MDHDDGTKSGSNDLFLAIGEFFVTFSHLISITEYLTAALISKDGDECSYKRARIAVSNLTAQPLSNAFFSVLCEFQTANWTECDREILKAARSEFDNLISIRNRFAHDTWHLGHPNLPRPAPDSWHRIRTFGSQKSGLVVQSEVATVEQVQQLIALTKRIDSNVRQLSLAGVAGDEYRPELHLKFVADAAGKKNVMCTRDAPNG